MPSWFDYSSSSQSSRQNGGGSGSHRSDQYDRASSGRSELGEHGYARADRFSQQSRYFNDHTDSSIRRAASTREAARRDVSPPRSRAEQPRYVHDSRIDFSEHRSVSPLGSSRFERPYQYTNTDTTSSSLRRAATKREVREMPHYGYDGYHGNSAATNGYSYNSGTGAGVSRSNAVRGRTTDRVTGYGGGASDGRYQEARRQPQRGSNFRSGGFSDWERY
ncbi:hypothetical protein FB567DRAFT_611292 [Paraphoma chrysanthemicola]|uniref:Uncharacterized protein n=1 Tax=Paraphoma chrysanthemicola TaxID=798071 RepID=A0A8K0QY77_9PLEO|nr:hypothetical protein FB567DRAFT_611292 [Paraphoma chrysanthemicola]